MVDVHSADLIDITVNENGIYLAPDYSADGFYGVTVEVPATEPVLSTLSVTDNGIYTAPSGIDGYNRVEVSVPVTGLTMKDITEKNYDVTNLNNGASFVAEQAFMNTGTLQTVNLPQCVSVYKSAFVNCSNLTTVSLPQCTNISSWAFASCSKLSLVSLPLVTAIACEVFKGAGLSIVDFPEVSGIDTNGFIECRSLIEVNLPKFKSTYGGGIFARCSSLQTVNMPECVYLGQSPFQDCINLTTVSLPKASFISNYCFSGCSKLESIELPEMISGSLAYAFQNCIALSYVSFPKQIYLSGNNIFSNCSSLTTVYLPECSFISAPQCFEKCGLVSIDLPKCGYIQGVNTFHNCSRLTTVSLPVCSSIHGSTFSGCSNLTELYLGIDTYYSVSYNATAYTGTPFVNGSGSIYVPYEKYDWYVSANGWSSISARFVSYGSEPNLQLSGTKLIGRLQYLKSDYKPYLSGGGQAWQTITDIELPNCLSIDFGCFSSATALTTISLPACTYLGDTVFRDCSALTSVYMPNLSVISKNAYGTNNAFGNCISLEEIYLPNLESGPEAFNGCSNLKTVDLPKCTGGIVNTFRSYSKLESVNIPLYSYGLNQYYFQDCYNLSYVNMPNMIEIGSRAFSGCSALTSLTLSSCSRIYGAAFDGCTNLSNLTITYSKSAVILREYANLTFNNCPNLSIYVPSELLSDYLNDTYWNRISDKIFPIPE